MTGMTCDGKAVGPPMTLGKPRREKRLQAQIARSMGYLFRRAPGRLWAKAGCRLRTVTTAYKRHGALRRKRRLQARRARSTGLPIRRAPGCLWAKAGLRLRIGEAGGLVGEGRVSFVRWRSARDTR